jgi:hypothetical protein
MAECSILQVLLPLAAFRSTSKGDKEKKYLFGVVFSHSVTLFQPCSLNNNCKKILPFVGLVICPSVVSSQFHS